MKIKYVILLFIYISACKNPVKNEDTEKVTININDFKINSEAIKVADSIMYIANVKNPNPEDSYYMDQWLGGVKTKLLADKIFAAVYSKKLNAYNYITGEKMSIEEVKELENEFKRKDIGQILFTEDWYFDEKNLKMYKQVNSVMLAYFRYDEAGNLLGNKAGIRIYLNGTKPMRGAIDY